MNPSQRTYALSSLSFVPDVWAVLRESLAADNLSMRSVLVTGFWCENWEEPILGKEIWGGGDLETGEAKATGEAIRNYVLDASEVLQVEGGCFCHEDRGNFFYNCELEWLFYIDKI